MIHNRIAHGKMNQAQANKVVVGVISQGDPG